MGFDLRTRVIGVIAIIATGITAVVACGGGPSSNPSAGCEPGTKESCTGSNLCSGKQVCKADRTYDVCVCPPVPDASTPDTGDPPPPPIDAGIDAPIKDAGFDAKPFDPKPLAWIKDVDMGYVASISVDGNNDILVAGQGGPGIITKLDATGALLWQKTYLSQNTIPATVVTATGDAVGNAYVLIDSPPNTNYGGGTITQSGRVLLKLDVNGNYVWHLGPFPGVTTAHLVTRPNGNVVLAGQLEGPADFGSGNVNPNGASDGLVVELTPAKALVKVRQFGDIGYQAIRSIALDPSGNAYVVGTFNGTIDFGKGVMTGPPASGSFSQPHSVFVAKLNPSLDGVVQKNGGATAGGDYLTEAAVDPFGNVAIGGMVQSSIKLGANTVTAFTGGDLYFAYLDGSLSEIWSGGYGGYAGQTLSGFAARPGGSLVAAGFTNGTLSFGLGGLPVGTAGYFLVQFDTAGNPISNFGASVNGGSVSPQVMTYLGGTDYLFAGTCQGGTLVLPSGSRNCTNKAFVTRFAP